MKLALEWMRKSAEQGHVAAQHWFGVWSKDGPNGGSDVKLAVEWLRKSAAGRR